MSMFWGLNMKPNRKYTQTIVKSFHISGVALDEGNSVKFYITADKNKFIVATVSKKQPQISLDLNFCRGDKIMFQTTGDGTVSLIGYLHDVADVEDSDDEEFEDDEYAALAKSLGADGKLGEGSEEGSDDDDDEDDEDADDNKLAAEYSSFLEEEESGEEEEDDEEGESDDEEEDDDDDDDSEEEEVQPTAKKAKIAEQAKKPAKEQNGVAKKDQKQQQQQQKSKKDKKAAAAEPKKEQPKKEQPKAKEAKQQPQQQAAGGERTITGGVKVHDLNAGSGPEAKQGKRVSVYYIGRLQSNNKTFDSMQKGNGFKFALGGGEVIKGWDVGVVGMKVGGKRRITCPAHMAYGSRGHPPTIPPNSTLVFDVELKAVH